MESELESYRRKKRVETYKSQVKSKLGDIWSSSTGLLTRAVLPQAEEVEEVNDDGKDETNLVEVTSSSRLIHLLYSGELILKVLLWLLLYIGFLKIGFGAVFFILSSFWFIWKNMRSGARTKDEPSAYSVFNPNCEALDGTLKAEHLEKQLLYRS